MLVPTICFQGNCDEAIAFYKDAVKAKVNQIDYLRDAPADFSMDGFSEPNHVLNSEVEISGTKLAMLDGSKERISGAYFTLTLFVDCADEARNVFSKLAEGGQIIQALAPQFWAELCGDVQDKFGIHWHVCTKE